MLSKTLIFAITTALGVGGTAAVAAAVTSQDPGTGTPTPVQTCPYGNEKPSSNKSRTCSNAKTTNPNKKATPSNKTTPQAKKSTAQSSTNSGTSVTQRDRTRAHYHNGVRCQSPNTCPNTTNSRHHQNRHHAESHR